MIVLTALSALAATPDYAAFDHQDWREVGERSSSVGPVQLRQTQIDGVTCVEGSTITSLSVATLTALANDMVSVKRWSSAGITHSEELERSGRSFLLFQYYDSPGWTLASDRYWVIRATVSEHGGVGRYRWQREAAEDYPSVLKSVAEMSSGAVEPPVNYGEWQFAPQRAGTHVRYRSCSDFGGSVPGSVQRWATTQQLPELVADLIKEAQRR